MLEIMLEQQTIEELEKLFTLKREIYEELESAVGEKLIDLEFRIELLDEELEELIYINDIDVQDLKEFENKVNF